jgi:hypothetical protein
LEEAKYMHSGGVKYPINRRAQHGTANRGSFGGSPWITDRSLASRGGHPGSRDPKAALTPFPKRGEAVEHFCHLGSVFNNLNLTDA